MNGIMYLGLGFVTHFTAHAVSSGRSDLGLNMTDFSRRLYGRTQVFFHGKSGCNVPRLRAEFDMVKELKPGGCIIDIGGNDLCNRQCDPLHLAAAIVRCAVELISDYGVKVVIVMPLFQRDEAKMRPKFRPLRSDYNTLVQTVNEQLGILCAATPSVHLWRRTGMAANWQALLRDGIHFSTLGNDKYYRNIRGAAQLAIRCMHPEMR